MNEIDDFENVIDDIYGLYLDATTGFPLAGGSAAAAVRLQAAAAGRRG